MREKIKAKLEYLRGEIRAERISTGEIVELQSLAEYIEPDDVELLEWAGVPEFPDEITKAESSEVSGTHLQGYVETTFARIVEVFGEPHTDGDGYKVDAEWVLRTPAGIATIYNYKDGKNYNGEAGMRVQDITDWHIGGHNEEVVEIIQKALV
jgi:hypothetical protein